MKPDTQIGYYLTIIEAKVPLFVVHNGFDYTVGMMFHKRGIISIIYDSNWGCT